MKVMCIFHDLMNGDKPEALISINLIHTVVYIIFCVAQDKNRSFYIYVIFFIQYVETLLLVNMN